MCLCCLFPLLRNPHPPLKSCAHVPLNIVCADVVSQFGWNTEHNGYVCKCVCVCAFFTSPTHTHTPGEMAKRLQRSSVVVSELRWLNVNGSSDMHRN